MASSGCNRSITCSICLEPYRGRQPKLLPCLHTFCLPCLTQLADKSRSTSSAGIVISSAGGSNSPVTITCPTCRTSITLPPAGVSALHNNPYIDGGVQEGEGPHPLLCDLCEEGQEAKLTCSLCKNYFCTRCQRTHNKFCKSSHVTEVKVNSEEEDGEQDKEVMKLLKQKQSDTDRLLTLLENHVITLQGSVTTLQGFLTTLQNQNSFLCRDLATVQDKNAKLEREQEALQSEVVSLKDKNAILCQDNQQLHHEVNKLQGVVTKSQNDISKLQDFSTTLQQLQDSIQNQLTKLHSNTDTSQFHADVASLKTDQSKLQGDMTNLKTDQGKLEGEITNLKTDHGQLQGKMTSLKTDQSKLQVEMTSLKTEQCKLQGEVSKTKSENDSLKSDMGNLKSVQGQVEQDMKILGTQVLFQAALDKEVTLQKNDCLICDSVASNIGGGYDGKTGVFTAPVSGVYCFMATSSPFDDDTNTWGNAHIVLDNKDIGYFLARDMGSSTAHVSVSVKSGQKVWLRCYENERKFCDGWLTTFTGFLVQPDL